VVVGVENRLLMVLLVLAAVAQGVSVQTQGLLLLLEPLIR
jgi:hypothetical protein